MSPFCSVAVSTAGPGVDRTSSALSRLATYLELVRFSHTIFALPFAMMATLIAVRFGADPAVGGGWGPWWLKAFVGILLCMTSGRTAAMAFNRLVDRAIDAENPRTATRHRSRH